jgi:hypothetical protein
MTAGGKGCYQHLSLSADGLAATDSACARWTRIFKSYCVGSNSRGTQVIFSLFRVGSR